MAAQHSSRTTRTTTTADAVQPPRTTRGFAAFVAVSMAVAVTAVAPTVTAAAVVATGVTATTVAAVRSLPTQASDPPDRSEPTRRTTAHAAD